MGISPKDFAGMQKRLSGVAQKPRSTAVHPPNSPPIPGAILLGIDPSLRGTGYGVICAEKNNLRSLVHGTIKCPAAWEPSRCLLNIASQLRDVIRRFQPTICVIEGIFYAQNLQTAMTMGQARGAALVAAAEGGLEIYEIATRKVKLAIVGYGAAQKSAVSKMVQRMLNLASEPEPDAADALALALAYAQEQNHFQLSPRKRI